MPQRKFRDLFGDEVILTDTVSQVILSKHPEVVNFLDEIPRVLLTPDEVRRSVNDERVSLYYRFSSRVLGGKWVVVVVKEVDRKYISTIYATDRIKSGEILWIR